MKWILKILATCVLAFFGFWIWLYLSIGMISAEKIIVANPNDSMITTLESEMGIKFPDDLQIGKITSTMTFFDGDEYINIDVYSNYSEEQWKELIEEYGAADKYLTEYGKARTYTYSKSGNFLISNRKYRMRINTRAKDTSLLTEAQKCGESNSDTLQIISTLLIFVFGIIALLPLLPYDFLTERRNRRLWRKNHTNDEE